MRRAGERAGAAGRRCSREPDAHTPTALALVSYPHFVASDVGTPATRARSQSGCGGRGWRAARPPSPLRGHSIDRPVRAHIDLSSGLSRLWRGKQSERRQAAEADRVGQRPNCWCCLPPCALPSPAPRSGSGFAAPGPVPRAAPIALGNGERPACRPDRWSRARRGPTHAHAHASAGRPPPTAHRAGCCCYRAVTVRSSSSSSSCVCCVCYVLAPPVLGAGARARHSAVRVSPQQQRRTRVVPRRGVVCLWRRHEGSELRRAPAPGHCHQASLQAQFWELAADQRSVCPCLCPSLTVGSVISLLHIIAK